MIQWFMEDSDKPTSVIGQCKHCRRAIGARTHFKFVVRRWWHEVWCGVSLSGAKRLCEVVISPKDFKGKKVVMAPNHKLREDPHIYDHLIEIIETIMGGQVFISDESRVSDFPWGFKEKLERELDFHIEEDETFVEIVQRMKEMSNPQ